MSDVEELVDAEVDLRDFPYMPVDVGRLRDSDIAGVEDGEVFRAAFLAWCASWHQVPAASLPDDDAILARLTGYGRDLKTWRRLRDAGALRDWIRCRDGRLYHPHLADKAREAWARKQGQRAKTRAATVAAAQRARNRDGQRDGVPAPDRHGSVTDTVTDSVTTSVTESKGREGKGIEGKRDTPSSSVPPGSEPLDARSARSDRGSRLPDDWKPSQEDWDFAVRAGINAETEAFRFIDYWAAKPGADGRKTNWSATWRNWVRRAAERRTNHGTGTHAGNGLLAAARELAAENRGRDPGVLDARPFERAR